MGFGHLGSGKAFRSILASAIAACAEGGCTGAYREAFPAQPIGPKFTLTHPHLEHCLEGLLQSLTFESYVPCLGTLKP